MHITDTRLVSTCYKQASLRDEPQMDFFKVHILAEILTRKKKVNVVNVFVGVIKTFFLSSAFCSYLFAHGQEGTLKLGAWDFPRQEERSFCKNKLAQVAFENIHKIM